MTSSQNIPLPTSPKAYPDLLAGLQKLPPKRQMAMTRTWAQNDLYFLIRYLLARPDIERPWLFERCREVQASPNGHLDLWAREHYKSTIITFGLTIQDILNDPEITVGIFSHTRPIAKGFLRQIKRELESNQILKDLFPDIFWDDPQKQAPKWSEDDGIIVKRKGNPKESTVEAWGVVDGQPTAKHFGLRVYDDLVTIESVSGPEMIEKTTERWALSLNLGSDGGWERYAGTRYAFSDTYKHMVDRGVVDVRVFPATDTGELEGKPVLLSRSRLEEKRRAMGPYVFSCQMLLNPVADNAQGFREDWLRYYEDENDGEGMNVYILVDAASEKKKGSDYTAMMVIGLGQDDNLYWLDGIRDRLNLTERAAKLMELHRRWKPTAVGYERYGMMADIEYIRTVQNEKNYRFDITELGGSMPKNDRIRRLVPIFEEGRFYIPRMMLRTNYEGKTIDLVNAFLHEEYLPFPVGHHDDMLDAMARIEDEKLGKDWPMPEESHRYSDYSGQRGGWAAG